METVLGWIVFLVIIFIIRKKSIENSERNKAIVEKRKAEREEKEALKKEWDKIIDDYFYGVDLSDMNNDDTD